MLPRDPGGAEEQASADFAIRAAVESDVPVIMALIRELAQFEKLEHEITATEDEMRRHLFGQPCRAEVALACVSDAPIGVALFFHNFSTFLGKPGLYVEDIYVRPEYRGRGYGRALMIHLARIAAERGCGRFEWAVLDWNVAAIDFYRALGAESMSDWTIQRVSGTALTALAARPLFSPARVPSHATGDL